MIGINKVHTVGWSKENTKTAVVDGNKSKNTSHNEQIHALQRTVYESSYQWIANTTEYEVGLKEDYI
jgi:hypothetical protein